MQDYVHVQQVEAVTSAGSLVTSDSVEPKGDFLVGVQIVIPTGTLPRGGGIYAQVVEIVNSTVDAGNARRVVWQGYVRAGSAPASIPNTRCNPSSRFVLLVWALTAFDAMRVRCNLSFDDAPKLGGSYIHEERPGDGPGETRTVALEAPAAGANYANVTVPGTARLRIVSIRTQFTASAAVANRIPFVLIRDATPTVVYETSLGVSLTALASRDITWALGYPYPTALGNTGARLGAPLPDVVLPTGYSVAFSTASIDAGDQWSAGAMLVQEWAWP